MEHPYPHVHTGEFQTHPSDAQERLGTARDLLDGVRVIDSAWRRSAQLTVLRQGERNTVVRAAAPPGDDADGMASLVIKLSGDDEELAEVDLLYMQALTGSGVVPDVFFDAPSPRGFVMQDAGDVTLERVLELGSAAEVRDAIARMARVYARLHVEGRALVGRTAGLRNSALTRELARWIDGIEKAMVWLDLTSDDARVRRALGRITSVWYAARDRLTLTHGDPAPSNILFGAEADARLVDFEYGGARHAFYDLTAWDVICPLPSDAVQHLRDEYAAARASLGWPVDATTASEYPALVAYRALALLSWLPARAIVHDEAWVNDWSVRHAVVAALERLAARCREDAELERLAERAAASAAHWRGQWPDVGSAIPRWPALRRALA